MLALDRHFCFAGAAAVLMLVQVLAGVRRSGFASAGAGAGMTSWHARDGIMSCQGWRHVMPGMTSCHARCDASHPCRPVKTPAGRIQACETPKPKY